MKLYSYLNSKVRNGINFCSDSILLVKISGRNSESLSLSLSFSLSLSRYIKIQKKPLTGLYI